MLFASVLPALLFMVSVLIVLLLILGFNNVVYFYSALSTNAVVFITFYSLLFLLVFSYVLHSIRTLLLKIWSGDYMPKIWPFSKLIEQHKRRFIKMREKLRRSDEWTAAYQKLVPVLDMFHQHVIQPSIPPERQHQLLQQIRGLRIDDSEKKINSFFADLLLVYQQYFIPSLDRIGLELSELMLSWERQWKNHDPRFAHITLRYSRFREDIKSLPPQKGPIPLEERLRLLESLWILQNNPNDQSIERILTQLTWAYNNFTAHSLAFVHLRLLGMIYDLNLAGKAKTDSLRWQLAYSKFLNNVNALKKTCPKEDLPPNHEVMLLKNLEALKTTDKSHAELETIFSELREIFNSYSSSSLLRVHEALIDLNQSRQSYDSEIASRLDIRYGSLSTIKGTHLGNIIDSYNRYSYYRYGMASEIFWPKLQTVIQKEYQELLQDHKTILDFFITSASLAVVFFLLVLLGPRVYTSPQFWFVLGIISLLVCLLCYLMAVASATSLGHIVRSCYDLYRLKLLKSLSLTFPKDINEERLLWESYSTFRMFTYSDRPIILHDHDVAKKS